MNKQSLLRMPVFEWANAVCQARLQERAAAASLEQYHVTADHLDLHCPQEAELEAQLRQALAARSRGRWPKAPGGLHIFLAYSVSNWEAVLPHSLAPLGQVTAFNWREHGFDDSKPGWLAQRDRMNAAMLDAFERANGERPVDVVIGYLSGYNTAPEVLERMAAAGAVIFNFCLDDKLRFPGPVRGGRFTSPAALALAVDLNLTNAPESLIKYAAHGGLALFWPEAAHPEIHRPHEVPFDFDVSFVGACYGWRPRFIRELDRQGVKVECFGRGWPNGALSGEDMVRLYSRSRINLGFAGVGHSRKLMCLKGRDFEVPMSGGLYLTQANPELALVFDVGHEIVTYTDEADCVRQICNLLANPERAASVRRAGRARCLRDHTYERRWTQIFSIAGLLDSMPQVAVA